MKTRLFAIMFAVTVMAGLSSVTARGQTQGIRVDIPFEFTTANKVLPAGKYRIESATDNRVLWRISGTRKQRGDFLVATSLGGSSPGNLRVTFHRYGTRLFLAGFKTSSYEVSLPVSRREKTLQIAGETFVPAEVIGLETIAGGSR